MCAYMHVCVCVGVCDMCVCMHACVCVCVCVCVHAHVCMCVCMCVCGWVGDVGLAVCLLVVRIACNQDCCHFPLVVSHYRCLNLI